MCKQEREQANLAASQDQDGSQQQVWKGSWAGAHVHLVTTNLGSPGLLFSFTRVSGGLGVELSALEESSPA